MASNLHRYVLYMPLNRHSVPIPVLVPEDAEVMDLVEAYLVRMNIPKPRTDFYFYKFDGLAPQIARELYEHVSEWLRGLKTNAVMDGANDLKDYFPTGPAPKADKKIDIVVASDSILEGPDVGFPGRLSLIHKMGKFMSPSEGVRSEAHINQWVNVDTGVHPHRPSGNYGPSTALFHPALARLKHHLMYLDNPEEFRGGALDHDELSSEYLERTHNYLYDSGAEYKEEATIKRTIEILIGHAARWQETLETGKAKPDAVWAQGDAIAAILELKNSDGLGGNPTLQALLDFTKILTQDKYKKYVAVSNCPVILIGIMGSRLEISTAIFTDGVYADKLLSEEFYIDAFQSETVLRMARILKAVSIAITELRDYYRRINMNLPNHHESYLYPNPLPKGEHVIPQLNYLGKLSRAGELVDRSRTKEQVVRDGRWHAVYRAKMEGENLDDEVDVVVKFTVRYHEQTHEVLATKELAPKLHFCIPLVGGMYMVIMDYIRSTPLYSTKGLNKQHKQNIYTDVKAAIDLLQEQELVFGDLRDANIIVKKQSGENAAMLIDFDWAGKHQMDRYPASWNDENQWAPGVGRGKLMDKEHDTFMLQRLKRDIMG